VKILIAGGDGQVGSEFAGCAKSLDEKIEVYNLGRQQLDVTQIASIRNVIKSLNPSVVVNAAAYTAVDRAEEESDLAFAINRDGAGNLAEICAQNDIPLIQISTDYVFDGKKTDAYVETDNVNPLSVYGESKLEGEQRVQEKIEKHIILRTSWVFGPFGKNFVYTMIRLAGQKKELRVVNDQFGCPTSAFSIANAILKICESISSSKKFDWGIYHFCGSPETNWFEFSKSIIENSRQGRDYLVEQIVPVSTAEYPTAAVRPQNSVLNCDKIHRQFAINQQPWIDGLRGMIKHPQFKEPLAS